MPELATFLELTPETARRQWRGIAARDHKPRQDPFVPVETILAVALFHVLRPNRYGGGNIHSAPAPVHQLAATCKRTAGSWTNKMLNLDGSREHGQAVEPELFVRLHGDFALLARLYRVVVETARDVGMDSACVPDFLGLVDGGAHLVPAHRLALPDDDPRQEDVARVTRAYGVAEETARRLARQRRALDSARLGRDVLAAWDWRCGLCGLAPRHVPAVDLLSSVRLKTAPAATVRELEDTRNAVSACTAHGDALRRGLLGLATDGRVLVSASLAADVTSEPTVARLFGPGVLLPAVTAPERVGAAYAAWHAEHRFQQA